MDAVEISIPLLVAFAVSACLTPLIAKLARRTGVVDHPNERSVSQRENLPLMGGLAVAAGSALALVLALVVVGVESIEAVVVGRHGTRVVEAE